MKAAFLGLLLILSPSAMAAAGKRPPVVSVRTPEIVEIVAGQTGQAHWTVVIAEGFHVQANPASQPYLIPTKLELMAANGITPGNPVYPKGKPYRLNGDSSDLSTYEGTFKIDIPLKADEQAEPGQSVLHGKLSYQACDARMCLAPTFVSIELSVLVNTNQVH